MLKCIKIKFRVVKLIEREVYIMETGEIIEKLRRERKMAQKELAAVLNVSVGTVSNYENGVHFPDLDMLHKLMDFFGVSADYLLGVTEYRGNAERLYEELTADYTVADFLDTLFEVDSKDRESVMLYALFLKARKEEKRESGK